MCGLLGLRGVGGVGERVLDRAAEHLASDFDVRVDEVVERLRLVPVPEPEVASGRQVDTVAEMRAVEELPLVGVPERLARIDRDR